MRDRGSLFFFFFNDTATTEIYTLSLHDALPISAHARPLVARHDRDARRGESSVERVLAGARENLRREGHERLRDAAGDHHDLRVQAVHDRPEHRAEGAARLVDDR